MQKDFKALSVVDLLVILAIIGIVGAVLMNAYNGIQNSAIAVAEQKDQAELNQVMAQLHMSGGNIQAIVGTGVPTLSAAIVQSAQLTYLLQHPLDANSMTQKGTVGGMALATNEYIMPYPYTSFGPGTDDGRNRIVFNSGVPEVKNAGQGFIAVNSTNSRDWNSPAWQTSGFRTWNFTFGAGNTTGANSSNLAGSKYANSNSYLWNEDTALQPSPTTLAPPAQKPSPSVMLAVAFGNGGGGTFTLADYIGGNIGGETPVGGATSGHLYVLAYSSDGSKAVTSGDYPMVATLGNGSSANSGSGATQADYQLNSLNTSTAIPSAVVATLTGELGPGQNNPTVTVLDVSLNNLFPAISWGQDDSPRPPYVVNIYNPATDPLLSSPLKSIPLAASAPSLVVPTASGSTDLATAGSSFDIVPGTYNGSSQSDVATIGAPTVDDSADLTLTQNSGGDYIIEFTPQPSPGS